MYVVPACPVAAIRAEARYAALHPSLATRLRRRFTGVWRRSMGRRHAILVGQLDHPGILADFQRASRG